MNAVQRLYLVSHPLRISRYGAHSSLSTAERVEIIDVLTQTLGTALNLQALLKGSQQTLHTVSFLPVQQLFHRLVRANADYTGFLVEAITDLGGHAQAEALYRLNEIQQPQCFAECLSGISRGARRLRAVDTLLRDYRECAAANKDTASKRFFEECTRHNARFLSLIEDHLSQ
ncbi:hypothetical protein PS918_00325 [Pseudomonas fluorescens]|uniref:Uncharacterized protein n=1 Tax=Pseudomonas fluorescens TaxID=294 RepID=A0A5E7QYU5_PSEFL|nr:hypothetical protein [Pseudomonas fluorescens]VVP66237.1 hypothetical protein PS918_00325 [Pseudomonas fluorescens]